MTDNLPEDTKPHAVAVKPAPERSPEGDPVMTREDVQAINARLRWLNDKFGGLRVHVAEFRIPWPITRSHYEKYRKDAVDKWLSIMEKKGWELKSKVHVKGMRPAYGLYGAGFEITPLLDQKTVRVMAAFQIKKNEPVKTEVLVTEEPLEHAIEKMGGFVVGADGALNTVSPSAKGG